MTKKSKLVLSGAVLLLLASVVFFIIRFEYKISKLETNVTSLEIHRYLSELDTPVSVATDGKSYSKLKTAFGIFLIKVVGDVTPYLDGYKITFGIANPTNITFHGAKITVGWGKEKKVFDDTSVFYPGKYTLVNFALNPAKVEDMKDVSATIEFDNLSLR